MPIAMKERCICQICICGEHRCDSVQKHQVIESIDEKIEKISQNKDEEVVDNRKQKIDEKEFREQRERQRRLWETSPDQMQEVTRSLSQINGVHSDKRGSDLVRSKRSTKDKFVEKSSQTNRSTLPPINSFSDSDSGKDRKQLCICEDMYKTRDDSQALADSNQWLVTRPKRNKPLDNLRLEGSMEMKTTFNTTYDTTAKQITDKNVAVVMPSTNLNGLTAIKSSKKKSKHRPSTSLKAGGDGYFNTINKESYKNFVIIDDKLTKNKSNGKSVCCATVTKLPKVGDNYSEKMQQKEEKSTQMEQMEQINRSLQKLTTDDSFDDQIDGQTTHYSFTKYADTSVQTNNLENHISKRKCLLDKSKSQEKIQINGNYQENDKLENKKSNESQEPAVSWTVGQLEGHKQITTQDIDNIKNFGILDDFNNSKTEEKRVIEDNKQITENSNELKEVTIKDSSKLGTDNKHYVQQQRRQKKHKNESSVRLFDGDMDFTTTNKTCFEKSPNKESVSIPREKTAGKRSRKSGRKGNLFRESSEAEFNEPYGEPSRTTETTYQKQFGDQLYCPVVDLGSNKSEFTFKGEASGHKFFLPTVKY